MRAFSFDLQNSWNLSCHWRSETCEPVFKINSTSLSLQSPGYNSGVSPSFAFCLASVLLILFRQHISGMSNEHYSQQGRSSIPCISRISPGLNIFEIRLLLRSLSIIWLSWLKVLVYLMFSTLINFCNFCFLSKICLFYFTFFCFYYPGKIHPESSSYYL